MASNQEARLNLVISARDEARAVVEDMARAMLEQFRAVREEMARMFEVPTTQMKSPIPPELTEQVSQESKAMEDSLKSISDTAGGTSTALEEAAQKMVTSLRSLGRESQAQTKVMELGFEEVARVIQDSSISISSEIDGMASKMDEIGSAVQSAATKSQESGKHISDSFKFADALIGGDIVKSWGEKVVGTFVDATGAAVDFEQNIVNTSASLNSNLPAGVKLSTDQIKKMKDEAFQLGSTGFYSANQVAEAMNVMAKQGIDYTTIMGGAMKTAHDVAAANNEDLDQTSNVLSDIIHEMGGELIAKYGSIGNAMTHVGDAMTGAMHHARISMDDFLNTMKYVGPQASAAGVSMGDLSAAIALLGEHGIRSSQAGTTLRRMLTNLTPQSAAAADEMKKLGMITKDGSNIFYDAQGKMKPLADVQELLYQKIHKLNPEMQQQALKTIFGQYALSGMTAVANTAPEAFENLTAAMNKNGITTDIVKEKQQGIGYQVKATVAHFDTLRKQIGDMFVPVLQKLLSVANSVMTWFQHLPHGVQMGIVIFVAAIGVIMTLAGIFMSLVGTLGMVAIGFAAVSLVMDTFMAPLLPIIAIIAAVIAAVVGLYEAWSHNFLGIRDITNTVWNGIKAAIQAVWGFVQPYITAGLTAIRNFWHQVWPEMKQLFHEVWTVIRAILTPILVAIKADISLTMTVLSAIWKDAWNAIKSILKMAWDGIVFVIKTAWDVISGVFKIALDLLTGHWSQAWTDMKQLGVNLWNDIKGFFVNIGNDMFNFGENMIKMFADGIMSAVHWVENAANSVISKVKGLLGFHSPTKEGPGSDADTWMPNMMNMFTQGIEQNTPKLQAAIGNVAMGLKTNLTNVANINQFANVRPNNAANGHQVVVNINIDGRSKQTDQQLVGEIAKIFRTQMSVVSA